MRADEIECRISMVQSWGIGLLLYKDARCDQNILDETVGAMNWQRHHLRDNANCVVSIWDKEKFQWIEKEDTGTESNTEKEKGLASDSFKRACFNWGIGRELYTAPAMFVNKKDLETFKETDTKGRYVCYDRFRVVGIEYAGRKIAMVEIMNEKTGAVLTFGEPATETKKTEEVAAQKIGKVKAEALRIMLDEADVVIDVLMRKKGVERLEDLTEEQHLGIINALKAAQEKKAAEEKKTVKNNENNRKN